MWVRAMDKYSKVFKTVEPKRERCVHVLYYCVLLHSLHLYRLKVARSELDKMMLQLREKQAALDEVEAKVSISFYNYVHLIAVYMYFV